MNDWNPKKASLRSHLPAEALDRADARQFDVAQRLALEIEELELRAGVFLILGQDFSVDDAGALQNAVGLPE